MFGCKVQWRRQTYYVAQWSQQAASKSASAREAKSLESRSGAQQAARASAGSRAPDPPPEVEGYVFKVMSAGHSDSRYWSWRQSVLVTVTVCTVSQTWGATGKARAKY